jgi:hypothetical protein
MIPSVSGASTKPVVARQASNLAVGSEPIQSPDQKATGFKEAFKPMHTQDGFPPNLLTNC